MFLRRLLTLGPDSRFARIAADLTETKASWLDEFNRSQGRDPGRVRIVTLAEFAARAGGAYRRTTGGD